MPRWVKPRRPICALWDSMLVWMNRSSTIISPDVRILWPGRWSAKPCSTSRTSPASPTCRIALGFHVGLDEPFQHYHFAGRADLVAWSVERQALLHIENKTRIPDLQDCFGSFNAKRTYLGDELAARLGVGRWRSETHVMAALWSSETLQVLRAHAASFASVCPGPSDSFDAWWRGAPPAAGRQRVLVVFDPEEGRRSDRRRWLGLDELSGARPRYRDYAEAASLLKVGR